jgi:hypothetical protein
MHFNFNFSTGQILWTLTFAALLVLLVVLLGRDRVRRFPWFTASILVMTLDLLANRLLLGKLPRITISTIVIVLGNIEMLVGLLVLVELARKTFKGAGRRNLAIGTAALAVVGGAVLTFWKPWLPWRDLVANPRVAVLNVMLVIAAPRDTLLVARGLGKGNLLVCCLTLGLAIAIVVFGRRFHAGWRSHKQQIMIGLSGIAISWLTVQAAWQIVATTVQIHSRAQYEQIVAFSDKLIDANRTVYIAALVWWIVCLWIDEPGATPAFVSAETVPAADAQTPLSSDADARQEPVTPPLEIEAVQERKNQPMRIPAFLILGLGIILGIWSWTDYSRTEAVRTTGTYPQQQLDSMRNSEIIDGCAAVAAVACVVGAGILFTRKRT